MASDGATAVYAPLRPSQFENFSSLTVFSVALHASSISRAKFKVLIRLQERARESHYLHALNESIHEEGVLGKRFV